MQCLLSPHFALSSDLIIILLYIGQFSQHRKKTVRQTSFKVVEIQFFPANASRGQLKSICVSHLNNPEHCQTDFSFKFKLITVLMSM